jgi:SAM-dependent methyltransferase
MPAGISEAESDIKRSRLIARLVGFESFHQNRYARALGEIVPEAARWLDLGAGKVLHGGWLGPTPETLAGRSAMLVGCDVVVDHLRLNRLLHAAAGALAERLPFRDATFDLVTANMVVEHLPDPLAVLTEVRRVLKPGGGFLFVTPNRTHPLIFMASVFLKPRVRKRLAAVLEGREEEDVFLTHYRCNTSGSIRAHAHAAGFEVRDLVQFSSGPMLRRPLAVVWLECMLIRAFEWRALRSLRSNIICHLAVPRGPVPAEV